MKSANNPIARARNRNAERARDTTGKPHRIAWIDIARGIALLGMVIFHFTFDLQLFGVIAPGTVQQSGWALFARLVAGSFLFLSGVSLVLAHGQGLRARAFRARLLKICAAALAVTVATLAVFPDRFVYFGILHALALATVVGLPFLKLPGLAAIAAAVAVWVLDSAIGTGFDLPAALWWTGLSAGIRPSVDFIPAIPWMAPALLGIGLAKTFDLTRLPLPPSRVARVLGCPGRHSLAVYLLHQPLLLALLWLALRIADPA